MDRANLALALMQLRPGVNHLFFLGSFSTGSFPPLTDCNLYSKERNTTSQKMAGSTKEIQISCTTARTGACTKQKGFRNQWTYFPPLPSQLDKSAYSQAPMAFSISALEQAVIIRIFSMPLSGREGLSSFIACMGSPKSRVHSSCVNSAV